MWTATIILATVILAIYFLVEKMSRRNAVRIQKEDFKKDLIYLVQFPMSPKIRTISPFALKLETYLRLKKVEYEPLYSLTFSQKGQIPFIELNGEQIADSNIIIQELEKRGISMPDQELTEEQKVSNHLATICLENHTSLAGFVWRYGYNMAEFFEKVCKDTYGKSWSVFFFKKFMPSGIKTKAKNHGLGRHSIEEITEFSFKDLKALSSLLGDKPFFNGQEPSTFDCTAFGHLVQFVYMPLDIPQKKFIKENCPNLAAFVDRMRDTFWPDWEEMCQKSCMDGKISSSVVL